MSENLGARYETNLPLNILRGIFVCTTSSVGWSIFRGLEGHRGLGGFAFENILGIFLGLVAGLLLVILEARSPRGFYPAFFSIIFGLLVGFVSSNFLLQGFALMPHHDELDPHIADSIHWVATVVICYFSVSLFLKKKDEFALLIPFIRLSRQEPLRVPKVFEVSSIVDGRIADLCRAHLLEGPILIPRFVLEEVQKMAADGEKSRRERGRRGLDIIRQVQDIPGLEVQIEEEDFADLASLDSKVVELARRRQAQVVTSDYALKGIADLHGVHLINVHEVACALKFPVLPGDSISVSLLREGENPGQACGFLADGTMVVVENARDRIGEEVPIEVTSVIQKPQGKLVFGRPR